MTSFFTLYIVGGNGGSEGAQDPGGGSGVTPPVQLDWLKGPFLQNALCQVFQQFALEGDEENRSLVHKVHVRPSWL